MKHPLSRRSALQSLGALGLGSLVSGPALAGARPAQRAHHTSSVHTFDVGAASVTAIRDATLALPVGAVGVNAPEGAVTDLLQAYNLPTESVPTNVTVLLVDHGGTRTLIDTGAGDWGFEALVTSGLLVPTLREIGVSPNTVDRVVLSHFHPDHVGGAALGGQPTFPNATYHMSRQEKAFLDGFSGDNDTVETALQMLAPILPTVQTYDDGDEIVPGLTAISAVGHTQGHFAFLLESEGERLMIVSDATTHPVVYFEHPEWLFGFDMLPEETVATRRRLQGRAADEGIPLFASHLPFPGIGMVSRDGDAFRFTATPIL